MVARYLHVLKQFRTLFAHGVTVGNRAQNTTNAAAITTTATTIQTESLIDQPSFVLTEPSMYWAAHSRTNSDAASGDASMCPLCSGAEPSSFHCQM